MVLAQNIAGDYSIDYDSHEYAKILLMHDCFNGGKEIIKGYLRYRFFVFGRYELNLAKVIEYCQKEDIITTSMVDTILYVNTGMDVLSRVAFLGILEHSSGLGYMCPNYPRSFPFNYVNAIDTHILIRGMGYALHILAALEHYDLAYFLLKNGATPNVADYYGMTPLMVMCQVNFLDDTKIKFIKLLLKAGADP